MRNPLRKLIPTTAALALLAMPAMAATCSLAFKGENLWHGQCSVKTEANGDLHAEAHDYHCHAAGGSNRCSGDQACAGPWVNVFDEGDGTLSSYWSIESACHGGEAVLHINKVGPGTWRGDDYEFTVK